MCRRPAAGTCCSPARTTTALNQSVGGTGYTPLPGDYDGDGRADFVVYDTASGRWYGLLSSSGFTTTLNMSWGGAATDFVPVRLDADNDGRLDLTVYHLTTHAWLVLQSSANYTTSMTRTFGAGGDTPVPK